MKKDSHAAHVFRPFSLRNSLVRILNVYLRQVKVKEHRSGQGQVIKGQLSYSIEYSRVIHVLYSFLKTGINYNWSQVCVSQFSGVSA